MSDLYQEEILAEAQEPQCFGVLPQAEKILHGANASCGDDVTIYISFATKGDPTSAISEISWSGQGCVISRAAMSVLAGKIQSEQLTLDQINNLSESDIEELLGLSEISIGRIKCLLLGLRTLQASA